MVSLEASQATTWPRRRNRSFSKTVSGDIGFLLVFIILPTVIIVSGFWLLVFVRRDSNGRSSIEPLTAQHEAAPASSRKGTDIEIKTDGEVDSEEFWTELEDFENIEGLVAFDDERVESGMNNLEATSLDQAPEDRSEKIVDYLAADAESRSDTAQLPEPHLAEAETTTDEPQSKSTDDRGKSPARLVRSTHHVLERTTGRRSRRIARSPLRDESAMKGSDGV